MKDLRIQMRASGLPGTVWSMDLYCGIQKERKPLRELSLSHGIFGMLGKKQPDI